MFDYINTTHFVLLLVGYHDLNDQATDIFDYMNKKNHFVPLQGLVFDLGKVNIDQFIC